MRGKRGCGNSSLSHSVLSLEWVSQVLLTPSSLLCRLCWAHLADSRGSAGKAHHQLPLPTWRGAWCQVRLGTGRSLRSTEETVGPALPQALEAQALGAECGPWTSQLRGRGNSNTNVFKIIHSLIQHRSWGFIVGLEMTLESQCHRKALETCFLQTVHRAQL